MIPDNDMRFYAARHLQGDPTHFDLSAAPTDRAEVLIAATSYALGRRTYAVTDVIRQLVAERDVLSPEQREALRGRIAAAVRDGRAGAECDVREWMRAADALTGPGGSS